MENNFVKIEKKVLKFWKENKVFEKSVKQRTKAENFVFYEGPPTANGRPGIHHIEARVFKDIVCRYKTMKGFRVVRKAGWDTHGLPVELEVEKKLGIKNKKDIEKFGIAKFNKKCKESVWQYKTEWEKLTEKIGYWLDMKEPYITYDSNYIETVWWIVKQIFDKGLLCQDYRVVPYCPRCGTPLSSHEVAQGYKKVKENSVYVKFPVKEQKNTYLLVWTTTPWTLPGNVAIAVNPKFFYVKIKTGKEYLILVKNKIKDCGIKGKIVDTFKGKDLIGLQYDPLFKIKSIQESDKNAYYVASADFVTAEDGTGIAHEAIMYGEDDYKLGEKIDLPKIHTVDETGCFVNDLSKYNLAGRFVKNQETEKIIIDYLEKQGLLFKQEMYEHDYPFCWRCKTPLLYYAKKSWFIKTTEIKKDLIKNNQKINWIPAHLKNGRFGEWLNELKDWAVSRERYWGTPLPVWQCKKCKNIAVIGSVVELKKLSGKKITDLHRPFIDKVNFKCEKCGNKMERVPEVMDAWFDSGSMPFAQYHYPFENKDLIDPSAGSLRLRSGQAGQVNQFPADYICEAIDQTRGWFYTLLAISTLLGFASPYKNVISVGHVLDKNGEKMSKSKGNVVNPWEMIEKYGADACRWYFYTINQPGDSKLFNEKDIDKSLKKFVMTFWNVYSFFETYAERKFSIFNDQFSMNSQFSISKQILDRWIISKLNGLIEGVTQKLDKYDIVSAARDIDNFVINDLSLWYIRRSRKRFQKPKNEQEIKEATQTLALVLLTLSKLTSPFIPFLSEEIYQKINGQKSAHLEDWPKADKKLIDKKLQEKMDLVRKIVTEALAQRAKAGIKVRQPLNELRIKNYELRNEKELLDLIKDEVNVKEVNTRDPFSSARGRERVSSKLSVELDTKITPKLKEEGIAREVIRQIQEMRKKAGYKPQHKVLIRYFGDENLNKILAKNKEFILQEILAKDFIIGKMPKQIFDIERELKINGQQLWLGIKKK